MNLHELPEGPKLLDRHSLRRIEAAGQMPAIVLGKHLAKNLASLPARREMDFERGIAHVYCVAGRKGAGSVLKRHHNVRGFGRFF